MAENERLAINGGKPARTRENPLMFPGGMELDAREEAAALEVIRARRLFRYYGPDGTASKVAEFEGKFAEATGVEHVLALNSCTNALIIALLAAGIQPGDEVIVPAYTFVATASAIVAANAIPVIAEIDDSFTLDPADFERNITSRTRAVIPVHMRGVPCDMNPIMAIAKNYGLKVIEDAAQACGGSYGGKMLGSIGDAGCFSFQYHKIITAGEGGAITTNDKNLINRAKSLHDCGANWRDDADNDAAQSFPGFNCRMGEMSGALMLVQLEKRGGMIANMRKASSRIIEALSEFKGVSIRRPNDSGGDVGVCVMFTLPDREKAIQVAAALKAEGVDAGTMGGHDMPDWHIYSNWKHILSRHGNNDSGFPFTLSDRKYSVDMCPRTLELLRRVIHMNVSPLLSHEDVDEIMLALRKVLGSLL